MASGDIYQASINQSLHGVTCVNVFDYVQSLDSSGGVEPEQDLAEAIRDHLIPLWANEVSDQVTFGCVVVRKKYPTGGTPYELSLGPVVGAQVGEALPANAVAVVSYYTATYDKTGRGRAYFSGMLIADERDNCWSDAAGARLFVIGQETRKNLVGKGSGLGDFDRCLAGGDPPVAKVLEKFQVRVQVRKLRGRTMRRSCG